MKRSYKSRFPVLFVLLAVLGPVLFRCTFKKPVTPSWDVRFELPLFEKTYTMRDLADDSDALSTDENRQEVALDIDQDTKAVSVGQYLTAKATFDQNRLVFSTISETGSERAIEDTLFMDDNILVEEAVFDSGVVVVTVDNQTNFNLSLDGEIASLSQDDPRRPFPKIHIESIPPGVSQHPFDLKDVRFHPSVSGQENLIPYSGTLRAVSGDPGGSGNRNVILRFDLTGIRYRSVTGWLNRTEVSIDDSVDTGIGDAEAFRSVQFGSALLSIVLRNTVPFPARYDVILSGEDQDGRTESIRIQESLGASASATLGPYEAAPLVNLLPRKIEVHGKVFLGDGSLRGTIDAKDSISAGIRVHAPLIFSVEAKSTEADVDTIEMEEKTRESLRDNLESAALVFELENFLPFGFEAVAYFSNRQGDASLYQALNPAYGFSDTLALKPAVTQGSPGVAVTPGLSTVRLELNKANIDVFDSERVFFGLRLSFPGTAGMVKVRPDDYIRARCRIEATGRTDFKDEDEEKGGGS